MEAATKSLACTFCGRKLARSDALKRHWRSCRVRQERNLAVPRTRPKIRGRKPRACDLCIQLKRACTATLPCTLCVSREVPCTYGSSHRRAQLQHALGSRTPSASPSSLEANDSDPILELETERLISPNLAAIADDEFTLADDLSLSPQDFALSIQGWRTTWTLLEEHMLSTTICQRPTQLDFGLLSQFPFLENFTRSAGFAASFNCGSKENRLSIIARSDSPNCRPRLCGSNDQPLEPSWVEITRDALTLHKSSGTCTSELLPTTHEIVSRIRDVTLTHSRQASSGMTWSPSLEGLCYEFFHPTALQRHLALFWSCWYPNWPAIHRPSFDATKAAPTLVAAMALVGACLSPDEREHATAQIWLDSIEEIVFGDELFLDHDISRPWNDGDTTRARKSHIEILQAAYCVCLYQTWEGSKRSKRRVLRQRFNDVVYFARDIGLAQASLRSIDTSHPSAFDWDEFVVRESFSRLCSYICNIDASYTLFFRNPPRMAFSELVMELSSPELCFQAQTKEECFVELKSWRGRTGLRSSNLTVLEAVEALSNTAVMATGQTRQIFAHLSILNMFTIVHALYLQLHHFQISGLRSPNAPITLPLGTALAQWQASWSSPSRDAELADFARNRSDTSTAWQSVGFIKHAPEYWLLAHMSLHKLQTSIRANATTAAISRCEDIDMGGAKVLIAEFKNATTGLS